MSKNDITGDKLVSKVQSEKFSEGYDRIWGKPESVAFDVPVGRIAKKFEQTTIQEALERKRARIRK